MLKVFVIGDPQVEFRRHLFPLLKPFYKEPGFLDIERKEMYGISENELHFVEHPSEANVAIFPMSWNFYAARGEMEAMQEKAKALAVQGVSIWSFMVGDLGIKIPPMERVTVFRNSGERTKLPPNHVGMPAFIKDPIKAYLDSKSLKPCTYTAIPKVGFCGQAQTSLGRRMNEVGSTFIGNMKTTMGWSKQSLQPLRSHVYARQQLLETLEHSPEVASQFIKRKKYRAGVTTQEDRQKTTLEFYQNIMNTQYTLCVRGAGNFSIRLYETLAMGRIPLFVDTDCLMPLPQSIDWKKQVVWVGYKERHTLVAKLLAFHEAHGPDGLEKLQQQNRELWQNKLTLKNFFFEYENS